MPFLSLGLSLQLPIPWVDRRSPDRVGAHLSPCADGWRLEPHRSLSHRHHSASVGFLVKLDRFKAGSAGASISPYELFTSRAMNLSIPPSHLLPFRNWQMLSLILIQSRAPVLKRVVGFRQNWAISAAIAHSIRKAFSPLDLKGDRHAIGVPQIVISYPRTAEAFSHEQIELEPCV